MSNETKPPAVVGQVLSEGLGSAVRAACPLCISPRTEAGCCRWDTFLQGFSEAWARRGNLPTDQQWREAKSDWQANSTGWEAVQIAKSREQERASKAAAKPLVWLGGRNYAEAGSALALKYGRQKVEIQQQAGEGSEALTVSAGSPKPPAWVKPE